MTEKNLNEGLIKDFISDWSYNKNKDYRKQQVDKYNNVKADKIKALNELLTISRLLEDLAGGRYTLMCTDHLDLDLQALRPAIRTLASYERKQLKSIVSLLDAGVYEKFLQLCSGEIYNKYVNNPTPIKLSAYLTHYIGYENGDRKEDATDEKTDSQPTNALDLPAITVFYSVSSSLIDLLPNKDKQDFVDYFQSAKLDADPDILAALQQTCSQQSLEIKTTYEVLSDTVSEIFNDPTTLFDKKFLSYIKRTSNLEFSSFALNYYISGYNIREILKDPFTSDDCTDAFNRLKLLTSNFNMTEILKAKTKKSVPANASSNSNNSSSEIDDIKEAITKEITLLRDKSKNKLLPNEDRLKIRKIIKYLNSCGLLD